MPYKSIHELPKAQTKRYSDNQKSAFRKTFNQAVYRRGEPEKHALKMAHSAAKKAKRRG